MIIDLNNFSLFLQISTPKLDPSLMVLKQLEILFFYDFNNFFFIIFYIFFIEKI